MKVGDVFENGKVVDLLNLSKEYTKGDKQRELALTNKVINESLAEWLLSLSEEYPTLFNSNMPLFRTQKKVHLLREGWRNA